MLQKLSAKTNAINWFEIPVTDLNRATKFYETILDIKMQIPKPEHGEEMAFFPRLPDTIMAMSGIVSGALVKSDRLKPSKDGALIYLNASPSLQPVVDKIEAAGGKVLMPKTKIPAGYISVFIDTEGNKVAVHAGA
jgi:predicted enzyme related to lactoylglutathione lyase